MARTNSRSVKMTEKIVLRATPQDKVNLRKAAQKRGVDPSVLLRTLLIKENIITAQ